MRASFFATAAALWVGPSLARADTPEPAPAVGLEPEAALVAPLRTDTASEADIAARAARLGVGSRDAANVLLLGPPRPEWIAAAGGPARAPTLSWPLDGGRTLRGYGSGRRGRHRAVDIGAAPGTPIRAADRGLVAYADHGVRGYGRLVMLVHPGGWVTYYAHASELLVRPGQLVQRGEMIARVGHSGRARGDHLHFELREQGVKIDPAGVLAGLPPGLRLPARPELPPTRACRVKRGDTLLRIARRHGASVREIMALNGLRRTARLRVGQELVVPAALRAPTAPHRRRAGRRIHSAVAISRGSGGGAPD